MITNTDESTIICEKGIRVYDDNGYEPEYIHQGTAGLIYKISEEHAAKIAYNRESFQLIEKEHDISKILYENEISVPKPEGIFDVRIGDNFHRAFVMQYIEGANLDQLYHSRELQEKLGFSFDDIIKMKVQHTDELWKAINLGFYPWDKGAINCLCSAKEKKPYLIDFAKWGVRK